MEKEILEKLVNENKSINEIANILDKTISSTRYWIQKYGFKTNGKTGIKTERYEYCVICNTKTINGKMYCSDNCKSKRYYKNNTTKCLDIDKNSRKTFKLLALDYCGNKCKNCGYAKNSAALSFHHIDPNEKDFKFAGIRSTTLKEEHKKELDKCITVCENCHMTIHDSIEKLNNKGKQSIKASKVRRELIEYKGRML